MKKRDAERSRPIVDLLQLLGQRWVLRVLWELRNGALTFRALSDACGGVPSASLNARVQELRRAGVVDQADAGYVLTARGRELGRIVLELNTWSKGWKQVGAWHARDEPDA